MDLKEKAELRGIEILSVTEARILFLANCYECGKSRRNSIYWDGYPEEVDEGTLEDAVAAVDEEVLDKIEAITIDYLCNACQEREGAEYDRQVSSGYYSDRI